jgi:hypothetical protein
MRSMKTAVAVLALLLSSLALTNITRLVISVDGPYMRNIVIDGSFDDWSDMPFVVNDTGDVPDGQLYDFCEAYLANNQSHLFLATFKRPYGSFNIEAYLDTDQSETTGMVVNDIGADFKIVAGMNPAQAGAYEWNASITDWTGPMPTAVSGFKYAWLGWGIPNPTPPPDWLTFREGDEMQILAEALGYPAIIDVVFRVFYQEDIAPNLGHVTYTSGFQPPPARPDVAITSITLPKTIFGWCFPFNMSIVVQNQGWETESFDVTAYVNPIHPKTKTATLPPMTSTVLSFLWFTPYVEERGIYAVKAYINPLPGELDIEDNNKTSDAYIATILGDVNGDVRVDIYDLFELGRAYGSTPSMANWNPNCDLPLGDGKIDAEDLGELGWYYREQQIPSQLEVIDHQWRPNLTDISLTVQNTGNSTLTISETRVNHEMASNVTFTRGGPTLRVGETAAIRIGYRFTSGFEYELAIITITGDKTTYIIAAP